MLKFLFDFTLVILSVLFFTLSFVSFGALLATYLDYLGMLNFTLKEVSCDVVVENIFITVTSFFSHRYLWEKV